MKKPTKKTIKRSVFALVLIFIGLPTLFILVALLTSKITVNKAQDTKQHTQTIYLSTNGVHVDIILKATDINTKLAHGLVAFPSQNNTLKTITQPSYYAFGWGDENFYLHTPTWADLTFKNAFTALFLKSPTLMHITRYEKVQPDWVSVKLSQEQLANINHYLQASFATLPNKQNHSNQQNATNTTFINKNKIHLPNAGYTPYDDFYKAKGSYTLLYTCNTWANDIFKKSGLTASYWTPFDFGLLNKY